MSIVLAMSAAGGTRKPPVATAQPPPPPTTAPPPPPPEQRAPVIAQFTAEPDSIERGQASTLRWSVSDATNVTIDPGLGTVQSNGSRQVFPSNTTTYTLTATGTRTVKATATVNGTVPPPPPPPPPPDKIPFTSRLERQLTNDYLDTNTI